MTTGSISVGQYGPYTNGFLKQWSGSDDPSRRRENPWTALIGTSMHVTPQGSYPVGIGVQNPTWDDRIEAQFLAYGKLAQAVRGHEFHLGKFLGELNQVTRSVTSTARAFVGISQALKHGNLREATRWLARSVSGADYSRTQKLLSTKDLARTHLSLVYGWVPLFSDIYEASKAYEKLTSVPRTEVLTVQASSATVNYDGSQSPSLYSAPGFSRASVRIKYRLREELSIPRSLGLLDPAAVLWEITPWSFVIDWFLPIGQYLDMLSIVPFLSGEIVLTERQKSVCACLGGPPGYYEGSQGLVTELVFNRSVVSHPVMPLPRFRGAEALLDNRRRITNAVALIRNLYR